MPASESQIIFLTYANNRLKDDPENLLKIYDALALENYFGVPANQTELLREAFTETVKWMKAGSTKRISEILKYRNIIKTDQNISNKLLLSHLLPLYGYENGFCENHCKLRQERSRFLKDEQLTCLECDQFAFIDMLDSIIDGDESEQNLGIAMAKALISEPNRYFSTNGVDILNTSKKLRFKNEPTFPGEIPLSLGWFLINENKPFDLRDFLNQAVAWSLETTWESLPDNDLKRLKRCDVCANFFLPSINIQKKFCSDACKKKHERAQATKRKRRQREREKKH